MFNSVKDFQYAANNYIVLVFLYCNTWRCRAGVSTSLFPPTSTLRSQHPQG